ncbi:hypothetical protein ES703_48245 [subsurface metagenome]
MEDREKAKAENFSFTDALDASFEWVFSSTKLGCLSLIGIFLVVIKVTGWLGFRDTPWINVLWPFIVVVGITLIVALVFRIRYDFKVVVESELEAKEYNEMVYKGKRWVNSGAKKVILQMKWIRKK